MTFKPVKEFTVPARYTNVVYAAITTATARLHLLQLMRRVQDRLCYCDTVKLAERSVCTNLIAGQCRFRGTPR